MKGFICLHLIPITIFNSNNGEFRNVAIPVDRIDEISDYVDKSLNKGTIQSKILMDDGKVYYASIKTQEICNILNQEQAKRGERKWIIDSGCGIKSPRNTTTASITST